MVVTTSTPIPAEETVQRAIVGWGEPLRLLRSVVRPQRRRIGGIIGLSLLLALLAALQPLPLGLLADSVFGDQGVPALVEKLLSAIGMEPTTMALIVFAAVANFVIAALTVITNSALTWMWEAAGLRPG